MPINIQRAIDIISRFGHLQEDEAEAVMYAALSKGLSFKLTMGNILTLTPALTITKKEMDIALNIIEESIAEVERTI